MKKFTLLFMAILLFGCAKSAEKPQSTKKLILTSIEPQANIVKYLVDTSKIEVKFVLPAGLSPASFNLKPSDAVLISKGDYYIRCFVPFEVAAWENITSINKNMLTMHSLSTVLQKSAHHHHHQHDAEGVRGENLENNGHHIEHNGHNHDHEQDTDSVNSKNFADNGHHIEHKGHNHADEHDKIEHKAEKEQKIAEKSDDKHFGYDPHYWLSIKKNIEFTNLVASFIIKNKIDDSLSVCNKRDSLLAKLNHIDSLWSAKFAQVSNKNFAIFHPNLSYFAQDYNLGQFSLEVDGKTMNPSIMKAFKDVVETNKINTLFFQQEFDKEISESVAQKISLKAIPINTLNGELFSLIDLLYNQVYKSLK